MRTDELSKMLERLRTWPKQAREEALQSLQFIEDDLIADLDLARDLEVAERQARSGEGAPQKEVFERFGV